jgi:hypothetical protein
MMMILYLHTYWYFGDWYFCFYFMGKTKIYDGDILRNRRWMDGWWETTA